MKGMMVFLVAIVIAQQPCGKGIPCAPVAWELPQFPDLNSPTPLSGNDSLNIPPTDTPTLTNTPTSYLTSTPIPTFTAFIDPGEIEDSLETVQAVMDGSAIPIMNASGTPQTIETQVAGVASNSETFVGYVRTIESSNLAGPFSPLLTLLFAGVVIVLLLKMITFFLPVIAALFSIIRKIVNVILDFIPG